VHPLKTMPGLYLIRLVCRKESPRTERLDPSVRGHSHFLFTANRHALITPIVSFDARWTAALAVRHRPTDGRHGGEPTQPRRPCARYGGVGAHALPAAARRPAAPVRQPANGRDRVEQTLAHSVSSTRPSGVIVGGTACCYGGRSLTTLGPRTRCPTSTCPGACSDRRRGPSQRTLVAHAPSAVVVVYTLRHTASLGAIFSDIACYIEKESPVQPCTIGTLAIDTHNTTRAPVHRAQRSAVLVTHAVRRAHRHRMLSQASAGKKAMRSAC